MARGELLFYSGDGSIPSQIIELVTRGRFVHVEIDCGDGTAVGALSSGISHHPLVPPAATYAVPALPDLEAGMAWLSEQVSSHDEYGWCDLVDALPRLPVVFSDRDAFDCSHLAAAFVLHAGGVAWLGPYADAPERASPNDLARLAGLA